MGKDLMKKLIERIQIEEYLGLSEEQPGFRKDISTV